MGTLSADKYICGGKHRRLVCHSALSRAVVLTVRLRNMFNHQANHIDISRMMDPSGPLHQRIVPPAEVMVMMDGVKRRLIVQ